MNIIDCRFRPLTPEFMHYIVPTPQNFRITRTAPPEPESLSTTLENFKAIGISKAVVSGRDMESLGGKKVSNEYIASLTQQYPEVFIGVAGADPMKGKQALEDIEHAVKNLGLKGVSLDPFALQTDAADQRFYPIYELCSALNIPVLITIGPLPIGSGKIRWGSPLPIDDVTADFPNLKILASHAGFPYTQELVAIVWRNEHVYFESSIYRHLPGADLLVEAVNTVIPDKMVYASAYPYAPYQEALQKFLAMPYSAEVLPKILHENAERLFNLNTH